jgi:hypothetical protein
MLKQTAGNSGNNRVADVAFVAPRQVWLAGLGAVVVTREWARNDAGSVFRSLVKQGAQVEARTIRTFGRQLDSSIVLATTVWNRARSVAQATFNGLVESTAAALPSFQAPGVGKRVTRLVAKKPRAVAKRAASRQSRRGKRSRRAA